MKTSEFQFSNPYLSELNFKINENFIYLKEKSVEFQIKSNVNVNKHDDEENSAMVELHMEIGSDNEECPFCISITEVAFFKWNSNVRDTDKLLSQNAPALLLSYVRPIVSNITAASKYPAYNLPYMNFTE